MTEGLDTGRIFVTGFVICILSGCTVFQSRVNDETRVLRTVPFDPIWDLDLYELHAIGIKDSTPPVDLFLDSGRYYSFKDRVVWSMVEYHLDSLRIRSIPKVDAWYRTERPARFRFAPHEVHRGIPSVRRKLHFTGDTAWKWLGDMDTFENMRGYDDPITVAEAGSLVLIRVRQRGSNAFTRERALSGEACFLLSGREPTGSELAECKAPKEKE